MRALSKTQLLRGATSEASCACLWIVRFREIQPSITGNYKIDSYCMFEYSSSCAHFRRDRCRPQLKPKPGGRAAATSHAQAALFLVAPGPGVSELGLSRGRNLVAPEVQRRQRRVPVV